MIIRKCKEKDCERTWEISSEDDPIAYCSIECACYDGTFSVSKGWIVDPKTIKPNKGVIK
jgi:hypothetical protein